MKHRLSKLHVFFDDSIFHIQPVGGISRYVTNLALALAATDQCRVTLFAGWSAVKIPFQLREVPNLRVIHLPRPAKWRVNKSAARLSGVWRRHAYQQVSRRADQDVYHPSFYTYDRSIAARADAMTITFHDMIAELFPDVSERAVKHRDQKSDASKRADALIAVSKSTFNDLARLHPWAAEKSSITHLATGLSPSNQLPLLEWPEKMSGYFLMVGNREDYKNGQLAIRAFSKFSGFHNTENIGLVLCGGKPPNAQEMKMFESSRLENRVLWISARDEDLAGLYSQAIALLYPSRYEGFGLPVIEAMACGCPVITTKASSLPEVGGDACLYVDSGSSQDLANAMQRLWRDSAFRAECARAGISRSKGFSWQQCAEKTLTAYTKALSLQKTSRT